MKIHPTINSDGKVEFADGLFWWEDRETVVSLDLAGYNDQPNKMTVDEFLFTFEESGWKVLVDTLMSLRPH